MVPFYDWCDSADMPLGNHHVRVMTGRPGDMILPSNSGHAAK